MTFDQGWYRRNITITPALSHKHLYLVFEGAASIADVYVNGARLGEHRGAYTRFVFDATSAVHVGSDNELAVRIDNRPESTTDCLPCVSGLYTIWGGLYRNVWLLATNDLQIDPTYYASPGVFITPTVVSPKLGTVSVKVFLRNTSNSDLNADVTATVLDLLGKAVTSFTSSTAVNSSGFATVTLSGSVNDPKLWSPEQPNLYHVRVDVAHAGVTTDSTIQPLGFHTITWDFKSGMMTLNGSPYVLHGVDLHQEIESKQSAVAAQDLIQNFDTMQDLGVNFVRLAHYPRAQLEYDLCDERGIFCWSENGHSHNDLATPTADQITTEMVEQNYNHPSIIIWSVGNEGNAAPAEREVPVVHLLDSTRPAMVANMSCANADYRATNTYPGWYGGDRWTFKPKGLISEIGAGGVVATHSDYADAHWVVDTYEPEEYQQLAAETIFQLALRRNTANLGGMAWWTLRDFNDIKYKHADAPFHHGINSKGLLTYGGYPKDVYYLYRCFLRPSTPTLHITSKEYFIRTGSVDNGVKVYSSASAVTLFLNGSEVSTLKNGSYEQVDPANQTGNGEIDNVFYWPVPLRTGKNVVRATDSNGQTDSEIVYFYGSNGVPELPDTAVVIKDLTSSNPNNQAYYMDMPVHAQWPVYYDFDGYADNTLDQIPQSLEGASWLALRRVTRLGQTTRVSFTATKPITVYVIATKEDTEPSALISAGFAKVDIPEFQWRGNDLILVDAELYSEKLSAGASLSIPLGDRDAMVLFK
jgi:beta-galactosidase